MNPEHSAVAEKLQSFDDRYGASATLWHQAKERAPDAVHRWVGGLPAHPSDVGEPQQLLNAVKEFGKDRLLSDQRERFDLALQAGDTRAARAALNATLVATTTVEPITDMLLVALQRHDLWYPAVAVIERLEVPKEGRIRSALSAIQQDTNFPVLLRTRAEGILGGNA